MATLAYGLDFGTTNSVISVLCDGRAEVLPSGKFGQKTMPSVLYFPEEGPSLPSVGHEAILRYQRAGMRGRLLRSIKSTLRSPYFKATSIEGHGYVRVEQLVAYILAALKARADILVGEDVTNVVMGRPGRFSEDPEIDTMAEERLREAAKIAGFKNIRFQREPIAAAFYHESSLDHDELALVADIGGGTSDFTLVRLSPGRAARADRAADILGVDGVYAGGDDFDSHIMWHKVTPHFGANARWRDDGKWYEMPTRIMRSICTWRDITILRDNRTREFLERLQHASDDPAAIRRLRCLVNESYGYGLFQAIEEAKCGLSERPREEVYFSEGDIDISQPILREEFDRMLHKDLRKIEGCLDRLLQTTGIDPETIDTVFLTGGSSKVPCVIQLLEKRFGANRLAKGDAFISVGAGLALSARLFF